MNITQSNNTYDEDITITEDMIKARKELGISQYKLSNITGIGQANICRIETGKFNPSIAMLKRIAQALGKKLVIKLQ